VTVLLCTRVLFGMCASTLLLHCCVTTSVKRHTTLLLLLLLLLLLCTLLLHTACSAVPRTHTTYMCDLHCEVSLSLTNGVLCPKSNIYCVSNSLLYTSSSICSCCAIERTMFTSHCSLLPTLKRSCTRKKKSYCLLLRHAHANLNASYLLRSYMLLSLYYTMITSSTSATCSCTICSLVHSTVAAHSSVATV
jgi:hypothetical protein